MNTILLFLTIIAWPVAVGCWMACGIMIMNYVMEGFRDEGFPLLTRLAMNSSRQAAIGYAILASIPTLWLIAYYRTAV